MSFDLAARRRLDTDLAQLAGEGVLVLPLDELEDLVREPDRDVFADARSPEQAGVDDLATTLTAARRLPDELTVRVVLGRSPGSPGGGATAAVPAAQVAAAEAALHRRAGYLATVAWREGMAVRSMGRAQLPIGLLVAVVAAVVAYAAAGLASSTSGWTVGLFAVVAGLAITVAWVVSWMVIESATLDWRPSARRAAAYDLLARARLEVVEEDTAGG